MSAEEKQVMINLLAVARYPSMPDYPIQFMTMGKLTLHGTEEAELVYSETLSDEESREMDRTDVTLTLRKGSVLMVRTGDYRNTMLFETGQHFEGKYGTPYGEMDMGIQTLFSDCSFSPEKGNIHLKYELYFQGTYSSTNELHLEYKVNRDLRETETAIDVQ